MPTTLLQQEGRKCEEVHKNAFLNIFLQDSLKKPGGVIHIQDPHHCLSQLSAICLQPQAQIVPSCAAGVRKKLPDFYIFLFFFDFPDHKKIIFFLEKLFPEKISFESINGKTPAPLCSPTWLKLTSWGETGTLLKVSTVENAFIKSERPSFMSAGKLL